MADVQIDLRKVVNRLGTQLGQALVDLAAAHEMVEAQEARIAELTAAPSTGTLAADETPVADTSS